MSTANKYMQSASGVGGAGLDVGDVFSTHLYTGNGSTQTITNGIDLDGEGGLVWTKNRDAGWYSHVLVDSARGTSNSPYISSNNTNAQATDSGGITQLNSNGYTIGSGASWNANNDSHVSWTFRKAEKFFDVVTYTGDGTNNRQIAHDLDATVGMVVVKRLDSTGDFFTWHRTFSNNQNVVLNDNFAVTTLQNYLVTASSTTFTVGSNTDVNRSGSSYVAYLFAHNNNDGEFGPDADQDIIKCGVASYPASGDVEVDLGFEPQWVMYKDVNHSGNNWWILDTMRGWNAQETGGTFSSTTGGNAKALFPDTSGAEVGYDYGALTSTGFKLPSNFNYGDNNTDYIYIAIRRGPLAPPTSATEVFDIDVSTASQPYSVTTSLNYVDATINRVLTSGQAFLHNRLTGSKWMFTDSRNAESNSPNDVRYDFNGKVMPYFYTSGDSHVNYMWRRAPNYFDVVAWKVDGTGDQTINHNLGVIPEMVIHKNRNDSGGGSGDWYIAHKDLSGWDSSNENDRHVLKFTSAASAQEGYHRDFTDTSIRLLSNGAGGYNTSHGCIAYLFASLDGVSKVGSVTHSGTTNVDCGFSAGSRFVLLKRTDASGDWYIWDSTRGIVSGNDPYLLLNTTGAEVTNTDYIDPLSSGFTITSSLTAGTYIFYAIA